MIRITDLTDADVGAWVKFTDHGRVETGRVKSWNDETVFVVYHVDGDWDKFRDFTGCSTKPEYLEFV